MKFKKSSPNNTPSMCLYGIQSEQMLSDKLINQLISTKLHKYIVYGQALPYVTDRMKLWESRGEGTSSNVVSTIFPPSPLNEIGLTELTNLGGGERSPHPLCPHTVPTALSMPGLSQAGGLGGLKPFWQIS